MAGWLAAWGMAGWLRPRKAREAQRGPERRTVDRISLSCAWLEAPHKQICDQGGSPQISSRNQRGAPRTQGSKQKSTSNPGPPRKQPGKFPTSRIMYICTTSRITTREAYPQEDLCTTRELAVWLAGGIMSREPVAGWPAEAQRRPERGPERPRKAEWG